MLMRLMLVLCLLCSPSAFAATVLVAVASNFTKPMTEIAEVFAKETGHSAKLSFGSTGKFMAQFTNGAPFEMFLAADNQSPVELTQSGLAVADSHFVYAIGKLALWSKQAGVVDGNGAILQQGGFKHLALADPKLAPYGEAAVAVMTSLGVAKTLQPLLVMGENISQTYQFVETGNAELGFVALSQIWDNGQVREGSAWLVPATLYKPLLQGVVLLKTGAENPAAHALLSFLKSPQALNIIEKYGYDLPK